MNEKICEIITKLSKESQNKKLRLFAKLDLNTKLEIFDNHKIIFHTLKNIHKNKEQSLCMFPISHVEALNCIILA